MEKSFAYITAGTLRLKENGKESRQIVSHFGEEVKARALRMVERDSWKVRRGKERGPFFGGGSAWGVEGQDDPSSIPVRISSVAKAPKESEGQLLYFLETTVVGGLFHYNINNDHERRILHKEGFFAQDLQAHPEQKMLAFTMRHNDLISNIMTMDIDGNSFNGVTEGDSIDESPSWIPNDPHSLLFHSAGIARSQDGEWAGLGPFCIQRINIKTGEIKTLAQEAEHDLLQPRMNSGEDLFYVRRPYETLGYRSSSAWETTKTIFLMPFRIAKALFHFMNAFTAAFSDKPLTTAGGPNHLGPDPYRLMIRGRAVDARQTMKTAQQNQEAPSIVPRSWELVCRSKEDQTEKVLANGVVDFDLHPSGAILYTNGSGIYELKNDGTTSLLHKDSLIQKVVCL